MSLSNREFVIQRCLLISKRYSLALINAIRQRDKGNRWSMREYAKAAVYWRSLHRATLEAGIKATF